ncbi:MAG: BON domain-containing protein [Myxococcota bacterium]
MKSKHRFLGVAMLGLCGACATRNEPPAASARSVDAATNTPNTQPNFAPARADGMATATTSSGQASVPGTNPNSETRTQRTPTGESQAWNQSGTPNQTGTPSDAARSDSARSNESEPGAGFAPSPTTAAGTRPATDTGERAKTSSDRAAPDNTRVNERDRNNTNVVPTDQGGSEADRKTTQQIRQALMKDNSLSFTAKNVKIVTINGKVTLRGPVNSEAERAAVEAAARNIAGAAQVESQLEIKGKK